MILGCSQIQMDGQREDTFFWYHRPLQINMLRKAKKYLYNRPLFFGKSRAKWIWLIDARLETGKIYILVNRVHGCQFHFLNNVRNNSSNYRNRQLGAVQRKSIRKAEPLIMYTNNWLSGLIVGSADRFFDRKKHPHISLSFSLSPLAYF